MANVPTAARLRERLSYEPATGIFQWREAPRKRAMPNGDIAGSVDSYGYIGIRIDGKFVKAHRLAWLYVYGVWPDALIDHINGNKADNRIANLRDVSQHINQHNRFSVRNKFGVPGVYQTPSGKYEARITVNRRVSLLGTFDDADAAIAARSGAERKVFEAVGLDARRVQQP